MRAPPITERAVAALLGLALAVGVAALTVAVAAEDVGAVVAREIRAWRRG